MSSRQTGGCRTGAAGKTVDLLPVIELLLFLASASNSDHGLALDRVLSYGSALPATLLPQPKASKGRSGVAGETSRHERPPNSASDGPHRETYSNQGLGDSDYRSSAPAPGVAHKSDASSFGSIRPSTGWAIKVEPLVMPGVGDLESDSRSAARAAQTIILGCS